MTQETLAGMSPPRLIHRVAAAICPAAQRQWVHAMFAELAAIDGTGRRMSWVLGAASIVLAAIEARARTMPSLRMRVAVIVALSAALGSGILSYVDSDAIRVDDDLLAALSVAAAASLVALAAVAARTIFRGPEPAPAEGR